MDVTIFHEIVENHNFSSSFSCCSWTNFQLTIVRICAVRLALEFCDTFSTNEMRIRSSIMLWQPRFPSLCLSSDWCLVMFTFVLIGQRAIFHECRKWSDIALVLLLLIRLLLFTLSYQGISLRYDGRFYGTSKKRSNSILVLGLRHSFKKLFQIVG